MNIRPSQSSATRGQEIGPQAKIRAAESGRHGIAAKRHGIVARHSLLVAGGQRIREEGNVDIGLADEESLH
jgi:hypothetical protein